MANRVGADDWEGTYFQLHTGTYITICRGPKKNSKLLITKYLHIQYDIHSHHVEEHEHFHSKLHPKIVQVFLISHMSWVEEAYCPPHHLQLFEAEIKIYENWYKQQILSLKGRREWILLFQHNFNWITCLTSLYINLSNVNKTYDWVPIIARQSSSNFVLSEEPSSILYSAFINLYWVKSINITQKNDSKILRKMKLKAKQPGIRVIRGCFFRCLPFLFSRWWINLCWLNSLIKYLQFC